MHGNNDLDNYISFLCVIYLTECYFLFFVHILKL